jgi:uncharacterized protein (TIGR02246 family)
MRTSAALAALLLLAACRIERTETAALADPGSVARAAIEATLDEFEAAVGERDARRAAALFTPDGVLTRGGVAELNGRPEIADALESFLADADDARLRMDSESIDLMSGVAYQLGSFEELAGSVAAGPARGRFIIRWQRSAETAWRIQRMVLSPIPADSLIVDTTAEADSTAGQ